MVGIVGRGKFKWSQLAQHQLTSGMWCSDRFSILWENPAEEDDYDNYYYYEFIARNDGFWRAPEIDFRYETKTIKVIVDFKLMLYTGKSS